MAEMFLATFEYTGYISIIKLVIFVALFPGWLWLLSWVYDDASHLDVNETSWTLSLLAAGVAGTLFFLILPIFAAGLIVYLLAVGVVTLMYIKHRDTCVLEYEKILTSEAIKNLLSGKRGQTEEGASGFVFITANRNEVPPPEPKTPDFYGYQAAYDVLSSAMDHRASDIIFKPGPDKYQLVFMVDGALIRQPGMEREQAKQFIRFLKHVADLDVNEKRKPQKNIFTIHVDKESYQWRLITAGSTAGEQARIQDVSAEEVKKLEEIGLTEVQYQQLSKISDADQGVFLVTGPRKTGVTSTFYSMIREHDAFINSIETLEREPSAELPNVSQNVFKLSDTGTSSYSDRLLNIVRMGADIVGVADCQEAKTAEVAVQAASEGKLIYLALEADNVAAAIDKWIKYVGDKKLAVDNLLGVTNQRLMRKLCEECRQGYAPDQHVLRKFNIPSDKAKVFYREGKVIYDKRGRESKCPVCHGIGFVDRTGIFEVLIVEDKLRTEIIKAESASELKMGFRRAKMKSLQEHALFKVLTGVTSINEMIKVLSSRRTSGKPRQRKK